MMRRIDLLPAVYAEQRRQRRNVAGVIVGGLVVLLLLLGWWFMLGGQISDARDELAEVQARNQQLEAQIAELQEFADLAAEVEAKRTALQTVMAGDVNWPAVMTEIAMVIPAEVWLTNLTASSGAQGAVGTETAPIDIEPRQPIGRIEFQGKSLSMRGVGLWLVRLGTAREFFAAWLNDASKAEEAGVAVVSFDSTLELSTRAASGRFQRGTP